MPAKKVLNIREDWRDLAEEAERAATTGAKYGLFCCSTKRGAIEITCTGFASRHAVAGMLADLQHWVLTQAEGSFDEDEDGSA